MDYTNVYCNSAFEIAIQVTPCKCSKCRTVIPSGQAFVKQINVTRNGRIQVIYLCHEHAAAILEEAASSIFTMKASLAAMGSTECGQSFKYEVEQNALHNAVMKYNYNNKAKYGLIVKAAVTAPAMLTPYFGVMALGEPSLAALSMYVPAQPGFPHDQKIALLKKFIALEDLPNIFQVMPSVHKFDFADIIELNTEEQKSFLTLIYMTKAYTVLDLSSADVDRLALAPFIDNSQNPEFKQFVTEYRAYLKHKK